MTENNAINEIIKEVCSGCYGSDEEPQKCSTCGFKVAKDALKEIQQYRAIGTVEELKSLKENGAFSGIELAQIASMQMKLKEYQSIGTIDEFKDLKEKSEPKKIKYEEYCGFSDPVCPECKRDIDSEDKYCRWCGQTLKN